MPMSFEIVTAGMKHPTEVNEQGYARRLEGFCIKFMYAMTSDDYYDELYHYAIFETKEQAEALLARIYKASEGQKTWEFPKIDLKKYWITGGCAAASSLKGGVWEHEFIPLVKF